ncbi:MAG: asparagine synthase (glutamine-hydrolyzing) [Solirubrobacterales bacterium]
MCGIAGKVSLRGDVPAGLVEGMCEREVHRGPDSRGIHRSNGVTLGIQRLRIIDLETGDQPIYNEDRSVAVVLNGEIYNFQELRDGLERRGHSFYTRSDTEVIAHLYEERGPELVEDLHGMFSFAVWDERRRRLLLARDRVGKKPLFYAEGDGWLSFASELRALTVDPDIGSVIDPSSIDCYLAYGYVPAPWSIWRAVRKLRPGHRLVWENGRTTTERYWQLDYSRKRTEDRAELEAELRDRLGAAVRRRMISDVPLGAFLSGGVDSSIVVSEMAAASSQPVKTFSIGFEEEEYNELPQARTIAELFGTEHHEFIVKPDAIDLLPALVRHYGEPYADSSAIPTFYLAELTRRHVTVALNGDGGDESFAGYLRHVANSLTGRLDSVPRPVRRGVAALGRALPKQEGSRNLISRARRLLVSVDADSIERYRRHISVFNDAERAELLDPGFRDSLDHSRAPGVITAPWQTASGSSILDRLLEVDVNTYLPEDLLVKVDIATMAHSLEGRSPFLDPEVMEFAASLPPREKASMGRKKLLLRRAYRGRVPDSILDGPKRGFGVPLGAWFRGELQGFARELLLDRTTIDRGYLNEPAVRSILDAHAAGRGDRSQQLWALVMLEVWQRELGKRADRGSAATTTGQARIPS